MAQHITTISLEHLLYQPKPLAEALADSWDDFDIDPTTGKLSRKDTAKERAPEQPDEPTGGAFGRYIFGDLRKKILFQNIEDEPDTTLEKKLFTAIDSYINSNDKAGLGAISHNLLDISKSGKYKEFFTVKAPYAWRVLINLDKAAMETILGSDRLLAGKKTGVVSGISLEPVTGSTFSGWTTDSKALARIYSQATIMDGGENVSGNPKYALVAVCKTAENNFFLNIDAMAKYLAVGGSPYIYQKEVLAYGSVRTSYIAWKLLDPAVATNPIPAMTDYLQSKMLGA